MDKQQEVWQLDCRQDWPPRRRGLGGWAEGLAPSAPHRARARRQGLASEPETGGGGRRSVFGGGTGRWGGAAGRMGGTRAEEGRGVWGTPRLLGEPTLQGVSSSSRSPPAWGGDKGVQESGRAGRRGEEGESRADRRLDRWMERRGDGAGALTAGTETDRGSGAGKRTDGEGGRRGAWTYIEAARRAPRDREERETRQGCGDGLRGSGQPDRDPPRRRRERRPRHRKSRAGRERRGRGCALAPRCPGGTPSPARHTPRRQGGGG